MEKITIDGNENLEQIFFDSLLQYERYNEENSIPCWDVNTHLIPSIQFSVVDEAAKTVELRNKFNEYLATWDYLNNQVINFQS